MLAGDCFLTVRAKLWSVAVIGCLAALVLSALILPQAFRLTAFSDLIQCLLLLSGTLSFVPRVLRSQGRMRMFWALMTMGIALWLSYQLMWTYFEVVLRQEVPDLFSGDLVLFLHMVPLMAALAVRPHVPRDEYAARLGRLDFALLIVWWFYLYVVIVMPWQFAVPNLPAYSRNLNAVYLAEKLAFLGFLTACWFTSRGKSWRTFYANLFGASLLYSASSYVANWAIARDVYYSGSLYDIPLAVSMAWITLIGLWTTVHEPEAGTTKASTAYGVWVARCGMIAAFSLPIFAAWTLSDNAVPLRVRSFRLILTLAAALAMSVMVFVRQRRLDRELQRLLNHSQDSFENLKRLQSQVLQSEKLASIGQLVGGAAHELNNPITAMLGYSDLLLGTQLSPEQQALATKISHNVRRTKSLVASLLSFAKRAPASKTPLDLNTLARTAVKLTQPQWQALNIEVRMELGSDIPKVLGDSNQLLQVCLQILGNALHAMSEQGGRTLTLSTLSGNGLAALQISHEAPAAQANENAGAAEEPEDALGLSACQGIVREHRGRIICEQRDSGGTTIRVELPCGASLTAMTPVVLLPQSPPSA
jgi:signal transduction histidine kinase